mmetsp:Transcript_7146/g.13769  ORF Transcript_7146/g.13769 Transcript_7146/m.13769 type:complete len:280 (-) Transcript_7146:270-1109(-)
MLRPLCLLAIHASKSSVRDLSVKDLGNSGSNSDLCPSTTVSRLELAGACSGNTASRTNGMLSGVFNSSVAVDVGSCASCTSSRGHGHSVASPTCSRPLSGDTCLLSTSEEEFSLSASNGPAASCDCATLLSGRCLRKRTTLQTSVPGSRPLGGHVTYLAPMSLMYSLASVATNNFCLKLPFSASCSSCSSLLPCTFCPSLSPPVSCPVSSSACSACSKSSTCSVRSVTFTCSTYSACSACSTSSASFIYCFTCSTSSSCTSYSSPFFFACCCASCSESF